MDSIRSILLVVVISLCTAGCGIPGCEDTPERKVDYGEGEGLEVTSSTYGIYQLFTASGYRAEIGPEVEKPYFEMPARGLKVNGSPVFFIEFPTNQEADAFVAKISPDGTSIGDKKVNEGKTPHFFQKSKAVGLYLGDKESTLEILTTVLGTQVAGGSSPGEGLTVE